MGFHLTHELRRELRHLGLKWQAPKGFTWGNFKRKYLSLGMPKNGVANSASSYQGVNPAYGVANDYKLDTRYRSLAELTGTN